MVKALGKYKAGLKVHRLTKMIPWNGTKWGVFFNIVPLATRTLLSSMLHCFDPISQKVINSRYDVITWTFQPTLIYIYIWSYISHGAQCGVTISHSTCCGYCFRDYHISFWLFALSSHSMPMLCLKDPWRGRWHNSARSSSDSQVIWVARNRENPLVTNNKKWFLLKHVCETINNKQTMFAFLAKRRISREEKWDNEVQLE